MASLSKTRLMATDKARHPASGTRISHVLWHQSLKHWQHVFPLASFKPIPKGNPNFEHAILQVAPQTLAQAEIWGMVSGRKQMCLEDV